MRLIGMHMPISASVGVIGRPKRRFRFAGSKWAPAIGQNGKRRRTYVLRVVLSHSRKAYSESVYRQTADNLIAVLENAFQYFGGVPNPVDNLTMNESTVRSDGLGRALVLKNARDWRGTL